MEQAPRPPVEDRVFIVREGGEYILVEARAGEHPDIVLLRPGPYRVVRRVIQGNVEPGEEIAV